MRYLYFELQQVTCPLVGYDCLEQSALDSLPEVQRGAETPGLAKIARELHLKSLICWKTGLFVVAVSQSAADIAKKTFLPPGQALGASRWLHLLFPMQVDR